MISLRRHTSALLVVFVCSLTSIAAQEPPAEYRIGSKDLLDIHVLEIPELNVERRVDDGGTIDLPLLGSFKIAGMTALEARAQLEQVLRSKYVNRANVSVVVKEFANKPITVLGAVVKPGTLNVSGNLSLLQAISAAGGIGTGAGKKIYILRRSDNGLSDVLEVDSDNLLRDPNPIWNVPLFPSDVVNIPARTTVRIFCLGEVKNPGALDFDSDDRITLLSVIAKAGGLTDRASKTIRIKRKLNDGRDVETKINYKAVIAGKVADPPLKADDVLIVEESFF